MDQQDSLHPHQRFAHRQAAFKSTPTRTAGEGVRRQVQDDQKKKRATLSTAARLASITSLSSLSLLSGADAPSSGSSDDDSAPPQSRPPHPNKSPAGVAGFVASMDVDPAGPSSTTLLPEASTSAAPAPASQRKTKNKNKKQRNQNVGKNSALSNVLMYTTLLPLPRTSPLFIPPDGLPSTSEFTSSWLALGPIPKGKRCLCVTGPYGSSTRLHTRISARVILKWVSALPGETVLDCLLDDGWKQNGIVHVLDILSWRSLDIASNPASFRIPFLHSRLSDLPPPPPHLQPPYTHPIHFLPVPYHPAPLPLQKWSDLLGPELGEDERKWGKRGLVVLWEEGGYGFGDELCGEEGGEFDDAPEGDEGTVEPQRVERGWVELGGEMVGTLRRRIEAGEPII